MVRTRAVILTCVLAASWAAPAAAQSFTGQVVDETTGRPVPTAGVYLLGADDRVVRSTLADAAGRYRLEIEESGEYQIYVERFGYVETRSPLFAVTADRDYPLELSVRPEPLPVEGLSVTVRNEKVEDWLTSSLKVSPYSIRGFRQIQGHRLQEAIAKSDDGVDLLRWLYLPAFNTMGGLCVGAYTGQGCLDVYVDGRYLPSEHLETLDFRKVVNLLVVPPHLHLLTRNFDFAIFSPMTFLGRPKEPRRR